MKPDALESRTVPWEKVYIFISSTFNDMHAERDFLVKKVFPKLADWCERRRLRMVDVDLRWGVTEEDATRNKNVVAVCLKRIDECRPFFLCFLGQRYGWVPRKEDLPNETMQNFPGVEEAVAGEHSATEIEILHALVHPFHSASRIEGEGLQPAQHAFFFLRDNSYLEDLPQKPPYLRRTYSDEAEEKPKTHEFLRRKNKTLREETIPETQRPVIPYEAEWSEKARSPELALSLACPALLDENIARWRKLWREAANLVVKGKNVNEEQTPKANAFNDSLTQGRLTDFRCDGHPLEVVILDSLKAAIAERFRDHFEVEVEEPTALQRELDQQDQFLFFAGEGFVERQGDFDELDAYVNGNSDRLFVLTASGGMGKSTLLAKWVGHHYAHLNRETGETLHYRFIGQSDGSTTVDSLLRLLLEELRVTTNKLIEDIPADPKELLQKWPELLETVGTRGKAVLVLDALNQLESGLTDLRWLHHNLPPGIKIIVSFKRGEEAAERLFKELSLEGKVQLAEVRPFAREDDRKKLVRAYLDQYLKELDDRHLKELIRSEGAENPLFLKIALSELRVFGIFASLGEKIREDFGTNPVTAFNAVLKRLENDPVYSAIAPGEAVPLLFGFLAHSRHGLSVEELSTLFVQTLEYEESPETIRAAAETVYLFLRQVRPFLARRDGRYDFFFESFQIAAKERYAGEISSESPGHRPVKQWHGLLAHFFDDFAGIGERKLDECPYQFQHAGEHKELASALSDLDFFNYALGRDREYEWMGYWRFLKGHFEPGECYQAAIEAIEKAEGETRRVADTSKAIGIFIYQMGLFDSASPFFQQALAIDEHTFGSDSHAFAESLHNLGMLYHRKGQYDAALPLLERVVAILEKKLEEYDHPLIEAQLFPLYAASLNKLAEVHDGQGSYDKASAFLRQALEIGERAFHTNDPRLATILGNLANRYCEEDKKAEALPLYQQALAIRENALGPDHPEIATSFHDLALLYSEQAQYAKALPLFQRALSIYEKVLGLDHFYVARVLDSLAGLYKSQGKYDQALPLYQRALAIEQKALGLDHPDVATSLGTQAYLYLEQGKYDKALPLYQQALAIRERTFGPDHPDVAVNLAAQGLLHSKQGNFDEAESLLQRALTIGVKALGPEHPTVLGILDTLAKLYYSQGKHTEALPLFQWQLTTRERTLGPDHPDVATCLNILAMLYAAQSKYAEALPLFQRALTIRERSLGPDHPDIATCLNNLASIYFKQNKYGEALPLLIRAVCIAEAALGPDDPDTRSFRVNLDICQDALC